MTDAIESPNRPDAEVEGAMVLLGSGLSSLQVAEITGIPARTLRDWQRSPTLATKYSEAIKQMRIQLALRTSQLALQTLDAIEDGTIKVSPHAGVHHVGYQHRQDTEGRNPTWPRRACRRLRRRPREQRR